MRTVVALFFLFHPSLRSHLFPGGNRSEDHLFAYRDGKVIDMFAGEIITLMAALDAFLLGTRPDRADLAVFE